MFCLRTRLSPDSFKSLNRIERQAFYALLNPEPDEEEMI